MDENPNNICVFVRVRPLLKEEIARGEKCCVKVLDDEQKIQVTDHGSYSNSVRTFQFDGCLSPAAGQELLMPKLRMQKLLDSVLEGYSSTVMAYGQTGSGKTYTMCGCHEIKATHVMDRGLIAQAVAYLFNVMRYQMEESKRKLYGIRASYFEIYNEQVNDLLRLDCLPREVRWDVREGYFVDDLLMVECESAVDVLSVLIEGAKIERYVGSHNMNKDSSRSHCILTLHIDSHSSVGDEQNVLRRGRLLFVDLAGSERLKKSRSGGEMLRETGNINRSLLTLGKVISALADGRKDEVVPYRESMLTKLIMESLGGNSHAIMIACVSPSASSLDQTLSTLHYATCTKKIVNMPSVNMDEKDRIIMKLQKKILELLDENVILKSRLGIQSSDQKSSAQSQSHPGSGTGSHDNIQNMKEKFCQQFLHHDEAMLSVIKYSTENQSLINSKSVESFFDKWQTSQRNNSAWKNEPSIYQSLDEKKLQQERVQRPGRKHRISVDHLSPGIKTEVPPRTSSRYGVRFQGNIIVNHNAFMRLLDRKEPLGD